MVASARSSSRPPNSSITSQATASPTSTSGIRARPWIEGLSFASFSSIVAALSRGSRAGGRGLGNDRRDAEARSAAADFAAGAGGCVRRGAARARHRRRYLLDEPLARRDGERGGFADRLGRLRRAAGAPLPGLGVADGRGRAAHRVRPDDPQRGHRAVRPRPAYRCRARAAAAQPRPRQPHSPYRRNAQRRRAAPGARPARGGADPRPCPRQDPRGSGLSDTDTVAERRLHPATLLSRMLRALPQSVGGVVAYFAIAAKQ